MATVTHQESARIFAFPAKRFKPAGTRSKVDLTADLAPSVYESCWYHDDAMKEEQPPAKPAISLRVVD